MDREGCSGLVFSINFKKINFQDFDISQSGSGCSLELFGVIWCIQSSKELVVGVMDMSKIPKSCKSWVCGLSQSDIETLLVPSPPGSETMNMRGFRAFQK